MGTFIYKEILTNPDKHPKWAQVASAPEVKDIVENFAESKKDYDKHLKTGFVKLCDLGNNATDYTDISDFLLDDPRNKLRYMTHIDQN